MEGSRDQSQEPIDQVCVRLFDKAEGKDNLPEVNPKDLLVQIINDATVGVRDKRDFYNKLLRKAVFHGNVDIVELVLTDTKDIVDVNHVVIQGDVGHDLNPAYVGWTPLHFAANIVSSIQYRNNLNINSEDNTTVPMQDKVTLSLTIIMLLWRNGANPMNSYKLGENDIYPVDVDNNCPIVTLLLRILMELKDATLAAAPLNMVDNDHKSLLEWACRCGYVEVATRVLARVDDPNSVLFQAVKGTKNVFHLMGKKTNLDVLDALHRKYPNLQQHVNGRTPTQVDNSTHDHTPMSIACQVNNDKFFQWVLRCFNNTLTVIDLYNTGLTGELPLKVFEFPKLKTLNVSKNKLTGISEVNDCVAFACGELEKAVFSDNKFAVIPKGLFLLPKLKELNFSKNAVEVLDMNEIEIRKIPIVKLNVSGNAIKAVPRQIFCLPRLEELNLDNNQIAELPVEMWFAPRLMQLAVNGNLLTELLVPTCAGEGVGDHELYSLDSNVSSNISVRSRYSHSFRETMMAPSEMIEFEDVDIRVAHGPSSLGLQLTNLQLNNNKLQIIPPNLACLAPSLKTLLVASNELSVTPSVKNLPILLKRLDLSGNRLTKFLMKTFAQIEMYPFENCPRKCFYGSEQTCTHFSHKELVKLDHLDMSHNMIDDNVNTTYDGTSYYELLKLNLSNNRLKEFPDFILHQPSLWTLDISDNPDIKTIPYELCRLEQLFSFQYDGISAPEVRILNTWYTTAEKLSYLRSMMEKAERNNSLKLMIVGLRGKGKTTLLKHLRTEGRFEESLFPDVGRVPSPTLDDTSSDTTANTNRTVGIKIGMWHYCKYRNNPTHEHPEIQFYTWDYAGEEEYYSTHQLFLHSRTLYLVIWNMLDGEDGVYSLLPWLQGIHAKAPRSEVIIVGTHLDQIPNSDHDTSIRRYEQLIRQCFSNQYCEDLPNYWPKIAGVHFVGLVEQRFLAQDLNVDELRDDIYDTALNLDLPLDELSIAMRCSSLPNMKMIDEMIPISYKEFQNKVIRAGMRNFRGGEVFPILQYRHFEAIATSKNVNIPKEEVKAILLFLQSKGLVVRFDFGKMSKYYFTDPEWLNSVFALLVSEHTSITFVQPGFDHRTGTIQRDHLENRLKMERVQRKHVEDVIELLESHHIAIPVDFNTLLVPALLADDPSNVALMKGTFPRPPTLALKLAQPERLPTPIAATPPIQMLGTGVVVRRLYVFHGIPIGFWPQLISHFYTEKIFFEIVNKALSQCTEDVGEEYIPRWNYSKRNIWLTVKNTTLLAVGVAGRDYMDMHQNSQCRKMNLANLHYISEGEWMKSKFKFNSGVLIEVNDFAFVSSSDSEPVITCVPDMFRHTAELLTFAVEMIDSLLSEVFHRPKFFGDLTWVKELIPCPLCLGDKREKSFDWSNNTLEPTGLEVKVHCCSKHHTIQDLCQEEDIIYYFHINQCLFEAYTGDKIACPKHGYLLLDCLAPDLMFQDMPTDKVYTPASFSQNYKELEKDESGAFGNVFKDYKTGMAIKIIKSHSLSGDQFTEQTYKTVRKEIDKLLYFKVHPHIANVLGVFCKPHGIVLELAPMGDLQSIINEYRNRDNVMCSTALLLTMQQVSFALEYLHDKRIVHRDVKPSNVLVFSYPDENHVSTNNPQKWNCESCLHVNGTKVLVKLSDFGVGIRVTAFRLLCNEGSEGYKAPEVASISAVGGYNEKVDIYSLAMILYVMLTLRNVPLRGIPNFGQFIIAGKRPKFTTMDPVYPIIFYECVLHCWKQDYSQRPSAEKVYSLLQDFQSSLVNKYTIETFSSIPTIAVVSVNGVQCLWAVTECPVRRQDDPSVRSKIELMVIQQNHPSGLEFMAVEELPSNIEDKICLCQLHTSVVVGYADQLAIYDASSKTLTTPYHQAACAKCACELKCLEVYANNLTALFAGQSYGNVHLLSLEDNQHPDSWVKYCYELRGEVLETMKACWCETHVELWCSTGPDLIEILRFPVDVAECDHQQIQDNIISLPLTTTGLVVAIECCVAEDHLLVFTMAEQASVVTCWDGHSKELIKNICFSEMATCIRVVEPNLYIGTESGDCMSVELQSVTRDPDQIMNVLPHSPLERYIHRGPVQTLIAAYGTMGCQGNLMRLFSSPVGEDHHGNAFRQGVACSLVLSIGHGYSSPWSSKKDTEKDTDGPDKEEEEVDNDLCVLVHLV